MLSYLIPVLNDIFESWRISEIASSFLICKYTVLSCHKTDCHMTTLLDFWIFRIQIQVVNNALRFFSKGHIVYIENPIIFLWIIIPQLCKQRSEILLCFSSLCDQFDVLFFAASLLRCCYKNWAICSREITPSSGVPAWRLSPWSMTILCSSSLL